MSTACKKLEGGAKVSLPRPPPAGGGRVIDASSLRGWLLWLALLAAGAPGERPERPRNGREVDDTAYGSHLCWPRRVIADGLYEKNAHRADVPPCGTGATPTTQRRWIFTRSIIHG